MRIDVVLPGHVTTPVGGVRVQLEFANRLAARGHDVTVLAPRTPLPTGHGLVERLRAATWPWRLRRTAPPAWFALRDDVRYRLVPDLVSCPLAADLALVTGWQAEEALASRTKTGPSLARRVFFAYDYEFWRSADAEGRARIRAALRSSPAVVSTSPAVVQMLAEVEVTPVADLTCGLDGAVYWRDRTRPAQDGRLIVGMPLRDDPVKGTQDGLDALAAVRERHPGVEVRLMARDPWPDLPSWATPCVLDDDAAVRRFYSDVDVFILPSHFEGWGLPAMEAMACGTAVVVADSVGVRGFVRHGENALVVPPGEPVELAVAIGNLLTVPELRRRLAFQASADVARFDWETQVDLLESLLRSRLG